MGKDKVNLTGLNWADQPTTSADTRHCWHPAGKLACIWSARVTREQGHSMLRPNMAEERYMVASDGMDQPRAGVAPGRSRRWPGAATGTK